MVVFLVGDAAHRIPQWDALGLNTDPGRAKSSLEVGSGAER